MVIKLLTCVLLTVFLANNFHAFRYQMWQLSTEANCLVGTVSTIYQTKPITTQVTINLHYTLKIDKEQCRHQRPQN
jgi:hypothetical protein